MNLNDPTPPSAKRSLEALAAFHRITGINPLLVGLKIARGLIKVHSAVNRTCSAYQQRKQLR
jgi:hypothetical protein